MKAKQCKQDGCGNPSWSKGYCQWHTPKKPIEGNKKPLKRKPLSPISDKRKKQQAAYKALLEGWLAANKYCARCGKPTEARHHRKHREGERLNDTRYWMPVCNSCHTYIHAHPEESYSKGWLIKG
jgi:NADH pyrophosphatase NudC (nudix superfamily)